jgi:hypothetical protein
MVSSPFHLIELAKVFALVAFCCRKASLSIVELCWS